MATAFNPYGMNQITVVIHNTDTKTDTKVKFRPKPNHPLNHYKQRLIGFLEEINKSYDLPTNVHEEQTIYTSIALQKIVDLIKDEKSIKKNSLQFVDQTREYFVNAPDMV